jgi:tetratricopeptide (TPR) repeat protein
MAKTSTLLACLALAFVLAAPRAADAGPKQEAKAHIKRATEAHKAGDHDKALKELQAAYGLDPQPQLLYAIGQIYTKLGKCSEASEAYLRFLATGTDAKTAQVVKQAIDACKAPAPPPPTETEQIKDSEVPPGAPGKTDPPPVKNDPPVVNDDPPPKKTPPPKKVAVAPGPDESRPPPMSDQTSPWYRDVLGDVLVVGGVTSLVLGGLAYRAARADLDTAEKAPDHEKYEEILEGARTKRLVGVALLGGGTVFVTAGVLRFMLRDRRTEVRRVGIAPTSGGGLLTWTRSF